MAHWLIYDNAEVRDGAGRKVQHPRCLASVSSRAELYLLLMAAPGAWFVPRSSIRYDSDLAYAEQQARHSEAQAWAANVLEPLGRVQRALDVHRHARRNVSDPEARRDAYDELREAALACDVPDSLLASHLSRATGRGVSLAQVRSWRRVLPLDHKSRSRTTMRSSGSTVAPDSFER